MKIQFDKQSGLMRRVKARKPVARNFAASMPGPQLEDWHTPQNDINSEIESGGLRMRNRARALEQDNAYFPHALREIEANVLGDEGINLSIEAPTDAIAEEVERAWKEFGKRQNFTADRTMGRNDFGRLALRSIARDGDLLIEFHRDFEKNPHRIAFLGREADWVPLDTNDPARNIRLGVQTDAYGEPVAYWRTSGHPGDSRAYFYGGTNAAPIPAERPGEINMGTTAIIPMLRRRFGQLRGYSWASAAIKMLRQLEKFEEAAVIGKRVKAANMGFFSHPDDDPEGLDVDEGGNLVIDLEPGSFHDIGRRTFTPFSPSDVNDYAEFRKGILRGVATSMGISYNTLANDLEGVSFSSIRQGVLSEREIWKILQLWYVSEVEGPIFQAWIESAIRSGALAVPFSALADIKPVFQGRRWDWVDPQKDLNAAVEAINNDLSSKVRENRKRGQDPRQIAKEREADAEIFGEPEPAPAPAEEAEEEETPDNVAPMRETA